MRTTRALLLKYYYDSRYSFPDIEVCYRNRGAPGDQTCVTGDRILHLDAFYMEVASETGMAAIPYHRILRIRYHQQVIWAHGHLKNYPEGEGDTDINPG
jgi:uncharacterized protein (UPF0248 family)